MEIENKVFYSELPSRNVYIDSVVNALPGYYPARSEFTVEYRNEVEQDLTNVCFLYDQVVNNGGEPEQSDEDDEDPLKNLLALVKKEPDDEQTLEENDTSLMKTCSTPRPSRKRKGKNQEHVDSSGNYCTKRKKLNLEDGEKCDGIKKEPVSEGEGANNIKVKENLDKREELKQSVNSRGNARVTQEDENVLEQLCLASIDIYNNRLRERNERKEFVRNHGFLDQKKIYSWYNIHNLELGDGLFNVFLKKFIKLFDSAYEFDKFIQQLKLERECRIKLSYLEELRANGIRHKKMIPLYNKLKENRNKLHEEIKHIDISDIVSLASLSALDTSELTKSELLPKRSSRKLDISHLPNYKCLTEEEKDLCSTIRLTPESYLNFKEIMMAECKKAGGLRLAQARPLLKIDVNKTRQVYDHLIGKKLIWRGE
uniref:Transcriptional adapter 2-alpha n=1 Tax=Cacopsylla melanoneura TaxID=428564 RepID=A0A8D8LXK0_9HEMI